MPIQKKIPSLEEVEALINDATENFKDSIKNPTVLSSEDLNTLYGDSKLGYYFGGGGNSCGNKPEGVSAFGLFVVKTASGNYSQLMFAGKNNYYDLMKRDYISGSWGEWSYVTDRNKLNISVGCDHEYEITGKTGHEYAVAIPDGQVLIKRINGQTRRKSLNLFKSNGATDSRLTVVENDDGSITLNGTGGLAIVLYNPIYVGKSYTVLLRKISGSMVISSADASTSGSGIVFDNNFLKEGEVKYYSYLNGDVKQMWVHANATYTNYRIQLMVVEGKYTADTMPSFEPYDDTLVNSKCNLKSTSRNLLKITEQGSLALSGVSITIDADTIIMNGTATSNNNFLISTQGFDIKSTYSLKAFFEQGSISGYPSIWALAEDGTNTAFGFNGVAQSYSINYKVKEIKIGFSQGDVFNNVKFKPMLVYGSTAPTEYEPYEESSMLVDKELSEYDYIDNVGHLLVKQTSQVFNFDGSSNENWAIVGSQSSGNTNLFRLQGFSGSLRFVNDNASSNILGKGSNSTWSNDIECLGNTATEILIRLSKERCPDLNSFKTWLSSSNLQVVFKLSTPTTEPIQLEAGYQVWNSGLQIQETETLPYILGKEYAVSLYSQILAVTSIVNSIPDDVASKSRVDQTYIKKDAFSIGEDGKLIIDV